MEHMLLSCNGQAQCKSGLRYTTSFEVVILVLGLKMSMLLHKLAKKSSFGENCNNIPSESCLQKKALSDKIILSKI